MHEGSISTYIPQVESSLFSYPLLACDTSNVADGFYDWTDPDRPHSAYDLTKDAEYLCGPDLMDIRHSFSSIKHYVRAGEDRTDSSTSSAGSHHRQRSKKKKRKNKSSLMG